MIVLDQDWALPPVKLALPGNEVHIWKLTLEQPPNRINVLTRLLSPDEQARASRFRFERDRRRFIVSHAGLRQILGFYLNLEPDRLHFRIGLHGKPYLAEKFAGSGVQFNLAHSHELALCAVALNSEVGIDLEYIHPLTNMLQIAARHFSEAEYAALCGLPENQRMLAFFNCWTRKEAYLKATGKGITQGLKRFQVSLRPDEPRILAINNSSDGTERWSLLALEPAPQYVGTLALHRRDDMCTRPTDIDDRWFARLYVHHPD